VRLLPAAKRDRTANACVQRCRRLRKNAMLSEYSSSGDRTTSAVGHVLRISTSQPISLFSLFMLFYLLLMSCQYCCAYYGWLAPIALAFRQPCVDISATNVSILFVGSVVVNRILSIVLYFMKRSP